LFSCSQPFLNYLAFQSFDFERSWWLLFQQKIYASLTANKEATKPSVPLFKLNHQFESFTVVPWLGSTLGNICVTNDHGYVPLVVNTSWSFFPHSLLITVCVIRLTGRLPCVMFVDRCLSFCVFHFWPFCCLFFFDIRIMITPLLSSNSSFQHFVQLFHGENIFDDIMTMNTLY